MKSNTKIITYILLLILLIVSIIQLLKYNKNEEIIDNKYYKIDSVIYDPQIFDTSIALEQKDSFPIKIVSIEKNINNFSDLRYQIITENGLVFYTNKRQNIGDTAFYIGKKIIINNYHFEQ